MVCGRYATQPTTDGVAMPQASSRRVAEIVICFLASRRTASERRDRRETVQLFTRAYSQHDVVDSGAFCFVLIGRSGRFSTLREIDIWGYVNFFRFSSNLATCELTEFFWLVLFQSLTLLNTGLKTGILL